MKKILLFIFTVFALISCSGNDDIEDQKQENPKDKYPPFSVEYHFFVELGLKPSQIDSINYIGNYIEKDDYSLLLGQRNYKAWISCFEKSGDEKFSFELPLKDEWRYSHYNQNSVLLIDERFIFIRGWQTNQLDNSAQGKYVEYISIINIQTGKETETLRPLKVESSNSGETTVTTSNKQYLIRRCEKVNQGYDVFYVINNEGKSLYNRNWTSNEDHLFHDGIIFLDNNIVAQAFKKGTIFNEGTSYSIINLKDWKLLKRLDNTNGFTIQGDNAGNDGVYYKSDTTFIDGNNIKLVYDEYKIEYIVDDVSGNTTQTDKFLSKYYYEINTSTYNPCYRGKYQIK